MTSWSQGHSTAPEAIEHANRVAEAVALNAGDQKTRAQRIAHLALDRDRAAEVGQLDGGQDHAAG